MSVICGLVVHTTLELLFTVCSFSSPCLCYFSRWSQRAAHLLHHQPDLVNALQRDRRSRTYYMGMGICWPKGLPVKFDKKMKCRLALALLLQLASTGPTSECAQFTGKSPSPESEGLYVQAGHKDIVWIATIATDGSDQIIHKIFRRTKGRCFQLRTIRGATEFGAYKINAQQVRRTVLAMIKASNWRLVTRK